MQFKILDIRHSTVTLIGPFGIHILFPTDLLVEEKIGKDTLRVDGIISMRIWYGCCYLYEKYRTTFDSFINVYFCPFCGTRVKDEVSNSSNLETSKEKETKEEK